MAADIVKAAHLAVIAAHHDDGLAEEVETVIVPRAGHVADVAHHLPAVAEDGFLLELQELAIMVDPAGQTQICRVGFRRRGRVYRIESAGFAHDTPR